MIDTEQLLARQLVNWLPCEKFEQAYFDDVGDPAEEVCVRLFRGTLHKRGVCSFYLLRGGITVVEDARDRWAAFESEDRLFEREYYAAWSEFARGCWVGRTPTEPGVYPTRDLEGRRGRDRHLTLVQGKLRDVTPSGGFTGSNKVSEWRASWWSLPFPRLRGAL